MCVYMSMCVCVHEHVCVCVHEHVCVCVYMSMCVCVCEREMGMGGNIRFLHHKNLREGRGVKSSMFWREDF